MVRIFPALTALAAAAAVAACAPTVGRNGFQPIDLHPRDIQVGTDDKSSVLAKLGSPSTTSVFEGENIWYYITQTTEQYTFNKAEVAQRSVTAITFDASDEKVADVRQLGLEAGEQVAMNARETPTRGRELTILEQLLGNVGRGQLPRTEENVPGQRRPD